MMKLKHYAYDADMQHNKQLRRRIFMMMTLFFHFGVFIVVNTVLIVINVLTNPGEWWFYWVTLFWGIGLLTHILSLFNPFNNAFGDEWEARKIQELMGEKSKRDYFEEES